MFWTIFRTAHLSWPALYKNLKYLNKEFHNDQQVDVMEQSSLRSSAHNTLLRSKINVYFYLNAVYVDRHKTEFFQTLLFLAVIESIVRPFQICYFLVIARVTSYVRTKIYFSSLFYWKSGFHRLIVAVEDLIFCHLFHPIGASF